MAPSGRELPQQPSGLEGLARRKSSVAAFAHGTNRTLEQMLDPFKKSVGGEGVMFTVAQRSKDDWTTRTGLGGGYWCVLPLAWGWSCTISCTVR